MKKKQITRLFIVLLISAMFSIIVDISNVKAANMEDIGYVSSENIDAENIKIMEYDAKTNITKEVDLEYLKNVTALANGTNLNTTVLEHSNQLSTSNIPNYMLPYASSPFTKVGNTTAFPYRATCKVQGSKRVSGSITGTGFLVGKNLLLTAAHCVLDKDDNDYKFAYWKCFPAYNGTASDYGDCGWSKIYYPNGWTSNHTSDYDWCLCVLEQNLGSKTGTYICQAYGTNSEMNNVSVRALGYANIDVANRYQYFSIGKISNAHNLYFDTSAQVRNGMSGGPIMRTSDNYAVGVVSATYKNDATKTIGARITQDVINLINSLK